MSFTSAFLFFNSTLPGGLLSLFQIKLRETGTFCRKRLAESRITCWTKALSDAPLMIVAGRMISVSSGTTSLRKRMPKVQETIVSFNLVNVKLQTPSQAKHVQARNFTDSMFGSMWLTWFGLNLAIGCKPHRYALKTLNFYSFFFIAEHTSNAILWHPLYFNAKFPSRSMMRLWVRLQIQEKG